MFRRLTGRSGRTQLGPPRHGRLAGRWIGLGFECKTANPDKSSPHERQLVPRINTLLGVLGGGGGKNPIRCKHMGLESLALVAGG